MAEQIYTSGQYKTQARPAVNPPAGFTETYYDSDNDGKLTTLFPDGSTIVLSDHPAALLLDQTTPQAVVNGSPIMEGIQFDTTPTTTADAEGLMRWNATDMTIDLGHANGVVQQIGQELFTRVRNDQGAELANGSAVYISGRTGVFPDVKLARSDVDATARTLGVVTQTIANPGFGFVTTLGYVRGIKTNYTGSGIWGTTWASGDMLYVSAITAGQLTNVQPAVPHCADIVATVGVIHGTEGSILVSIDRCQKLVDLSDVNGTPLTTTGQLPVWNEANGYFDFDKNLHDYKAYSGFENRTDSTISIDGSGVFTLAPAVTSFVVYTNGTGKHILTTPQTLQVTEDQSITYIYIDGTGVLQKSTAFWDLSSGANAPCSIVYKDGTTYAITDERHGYERNRSWHRWAHQNIGAMYHYGLAGTFTDTTLSVTQGEIFDEDIAFNTGTTKTTCSLWYRNATNGMRIIRGSTTPYYANTGILQYDDGSGTLQPVSNNKYSTQWVYASNDATEPIYVVIGQNNDTLITSARNATSPVINLSTSEWKLIYRVIYKCVGSTPVFQEAADFRSVQTGVASAAVAPTSHATLTGRELASSHPATAISYDNGVTISDVQTAIDDLQNLDDLLVSITRTGKDANDIFTVISYYDATTALRRTSTLSGGTSPEYTTRTEVDYAADGITVVATRVYTQMYDTGDWVAEVLV